MFTSSKIHMYSGGSGGMLVNKANATLAGINIASTYRTKENKLLTNTKNDLEVLCHSMPTEYIITVINKAEEKTGHKINFTTVDDLKKGKDNEKFHGKLLTDVVGFEKSSNLLHPQHPKKEINLKFSEELLSNLSIGI